MLVFSLTMLLMLALLDKALRLDRQKARALEVEFKFSALRDSILVRIADGERPNKAAFELFEELISNTQRCLDVPLLWEFAVIFSFASDPKPEPEYAQLQILLGHRDNQLLAEALQEYKILLGKYLAERHWLLIAFARRLFSEDSKIETAKESMPSNLAVAARIPFHHWVYS